MLLQKSLKPVRMVRKKRRISKLELLCLRGERKLKIKWPPCVGAFFYIVYYTPFRNCGRGSRGNSASASPSSPKVPAPARCLAIQGAAHGVGSRDEDVGRGLRDLRRNSRPYYVAKATQLVSQ